MSIRDTLNESRDLVISEYLSGASTVALGKKYGCSNASVYLFLRNYGVEMRQCTNLYDALLPDAISRIAAGESVTAVAKATGIPKSTLGRAAARRGQDTSRHIKRCAVRLEDYGEVIETMYLGGQSQAKIAKHFECDMSNISRLLKRRGVETRFHYDCDHEFFDRIDTEAKAYALGFFVADGYNHPSGIVSISIQERDRDILEKIKIAMQSTGPIGIKPPPKKHPQWQAQVRLEVVSRRMCKALARLGCPTKKTFVTRFPTPEEVPYALLRPYILGVFDGDGSLYCTTNGYHICIAGTKSLLEPMRQHIHRETGVMLGLYQQGRTYIARVGGNRQVGKVLTWMYKDATIYMDRKYNLFKEGHSPPR